MRRNVHDFESTRISPPNEQTPIYAYICWHINCLSKSGQAIANQRCWPSVECRFLVNILSPQGQKRWRARVVGGAMVLQITNNFPGSSRCILVDGCRLNIGTMEIAYIFFRRCTYKPVSSGHHSGFHCHVCWKEGMTQVLFSTKLKPEKNKHMPIKLAVSDLVFLFFAMSLFYAYPCNSCFMDEWGFSKLESKFKGRKTAVRFSIVTTRDTK